MLTYSLHQLENFAQGRRNDNVFLVSEEVAWRREILSAFVIFLNFNIHDSQQDKEKKFDKNVQQYGSNKYKRCFEKDACGVSTFFLNSNQTSMSGYCWISMHYPLVSPWRRSSCITLVGNNASSVIRYNLNGYMRISSEQRNI